MNTLAIAKKDSGIHTVTNVLSAALAASIPPIHENLMEPRIWNSAVKIAAWTALTNVQTLIKRAESIAKTKESASRYVNGFTQWAKSF